MRNDHKILDRFIYLILLSLIALPGYAQHTSSALQKSGERLTYFSDQEGNRIPDFSHAGYMSGEAELPYYPVKITVGPQPGDDTNRIKGAISYVEGLPVDENGVRGAVLLEPGIYQVSDQLKIETSGVVLRGAGSGPDPTDATILQVSRSFRGTVVQIGTGEYDWYWNYRDPRTIVTTPFVPVGSRNFEVGDISFFEVGDNIILRHRSSQKWLDAINGGGTATDPPWEEGYIEIYYNRTITGIKDSTISVDAPIFNHLDRSLAETRVYVVDRKKLVEKSGVEYLRIEIQSSGERSENHAENGVIFHGVENGWARYINIFHFSSTGFGTANSRNITIANSGAFEPHSPLTGEKRYNFNSQFFSNNILFENVNSTNGRRSFVSNGTSVSSGIVFLNAHSRGALNSSEGHQKWSQGLLYDNVTFENPQTYFVLGLYNRGDFGSSHGWGAVHSVAWNVDAGGQYIFIQKPPTAQNYGIGNKGSVSGEGIYDHPTGYIEGSNTDAIPASLYKAQLNERLANGVPPDAPVLLTVSNNEKNQLELNWNHSSIKETEFIIERSPGDGENFQRIATIQKSDSMYSDNNIGEKLYQYRVRAKDSNGLSAYSNVAFGEAEFTNDYIQNFHLKNPTDQTTIQIDIDPDSTITFEWDIRETELDIEYTLLIDRPASDFSDPLAEITIAESKEYTMTYRELTNILQRSNITIESEFAIKWTVIASTKTLMKQAEEQFLISLLKDPDSPILNEVDKDTDLAQNYPNPFNPVTTIRYYLAQESDVTLDIFDLSGTRVVTLQAGNVEAGYHDVEFDGRNLASGVYMYRLKTSDFVRTRKMILIK
ncbi:T9SS type A sorting domain-containing protein [Rhodohalobacter sulfatireducens]|uniref:T9SS type A sorting domain-containing protein n=1 Tax=Rhodohalobacter sulfatireducens TaxID=2911366 RepID=A0ABS9K984_9BACT|nr:T9SS type A sorting domain-containing protein [Rhodohalobacter sulfatireducens]MCG2587390.1 T9SS type A sorting domain-containing protein [Rhodohalobacter sulfatireducens]